MPDTDVWQRAIGKLEGEVSGLQQGQMALQRDLASLRSEVNANFGKVYDKLDEAKEELAQGKGGMRAVYLVFSAGGFLVALAAEYLFHLPK